MSSTLAVMQEDIGRGLRELELGAGDTVLVHSSLKSFGHVEAGPEAVIAGLLETVGPHGCVVVPTLTLGANESPVVFAVRNSPSTSGLIATSSGTCPRRGAATIPPPRRRRLAGGPTS
jgi:aminoglycoside 3-N-acetyltransferase